MLRQIHTASALGKTFESALVENLSILDAILEPVEGLRMCDDLLSITFVASQVHTKHTVNITIILYIAIFEKDIKLNDYFKCLKCHFISEVPILKRLDLVIIVLSLVSHSEKKTN